MTPPNAETQPVDQVTPSTRPRRWWLLIPFLILASLLVLAITVFTDSGAPKYQFLRSARVVEAQEVMVSPGNGKHILSRHDDYETDLRLDDLAANIRAELPKSEWTEQSHAKEFAYFHHNHGLKAIYVLRGQAATVLTIRESRSASVIDRVRYWFKSFGKPKAQQIDIGGPMLRRP